MLHATTRQGLVQNQGINRSGTVQPAKQSSGLIGTSRTKRRVRSGPVDKAVIGFFRGVVLNKAVMDVIDSAQGKRLGPDLDPYFQGKAIGEVLTLKRSKESHSTVTLFARFLGLSTSVPLAQAV